MSSTHEQCHMEREFGNNRLYKRGYVPGNAPRECPKVTRQVEGTGETAAMTCQYCGGAGPLKLVDNDKHGFDQVFACATCAKGYRNG